MMMKKNRVGVRTMAENYKPIMVNGVDVSECDFLAKEDDYCSYTGEYRAHKGECGCSDGEMCKDYPNCFYKKVLKQLVRKTRECEELKEKVKELRQGWINCDEERNLQEANSEFRQRVINRYNQTLAEIKEIVKNMNNECFYDDFDCKDCDMKNGCTYFNKKQILQKINEAKK